MSSPSDSKPAKKRTGRKRLPPLAPGPPIRFVVASHPDEFKAGTTMRHVRSHVMHKHREQRAPSPSDKGKARELSLTRGIMTRTPSPMTANSDALVAENHFQHGFLAPPTTRPTNPVLGEDFYGYTSDFPSADPMRTLAARIIAATTATPARSAPPIFEDASQFPFLEQHVDSVESLDNLKQEYIVNTEYYCHGMQTAPLSQHELTTRRPFLDATCLQQPPLVTQSRQCGVCVSRPQSEPFVR